MPAAPCHRYTLVDPELLRVLMRSAERGRPLTVRELGQKSYLSKSKISGLLCGTRPYVDQDTATRIARAVGVSRGRLFRTALSTSADADTRDLTA